MAAPPIDGVAVKNFEGEDSEVTGGKRFGEELTGQKSVKLFDIGMARERTQRTQKRRGDRMGKMPKMRISVNEDLRREQRGVFVLRGW